MDDLAKTNPPTEGTNIRNDGPTLNLLDKAILKDKYRVIPNLKTAQSEITREMRGIIDEKVEKYQMVYFYKLLNLGLRRRLCLLLEEHGIDVLPKTELNHNLFSHIKLSTVYRDKYSMTTDVEFVESIVDIVKDAMICKKDVSKYIKDLPEETSQSNKQHNNVTIIESKIDEDNEKNSSGSHNNKNNQNKLQALFEEFKKRCKLDNKPKVVSQSGKQQSTKCQQNLVTKVQNKQSKKQARKKAGALNQKEPHDQEKSNTVQENKKNRSDQQDLEKQQNTNSQPNITNSTNQLNSEFQSNLFPSNGQQEVKWELNSNENEIRSICQTKASHPFVNLQESFVQQNIIPQFENHTSSVWKPNTHFENIPSSQPEVISSLRSQQNSSCQINSIPLIANQHLASDQQSLISQFLNQQNSYAYHGVVHGRTVMPQFVHQPVVNYAQNIVPQLVIPVQQSLVCAPIAVPQVPQVNQHTVPEVIGPQKSIYQPKPIPTVINQQISDCQQKITSPYANETDPICHPKVITEIKPIIPANADLLISDKPNLIPQHLNQHSPFDRSNTTAKEKKQETISQDTSGRKVLNSQQKVTSSYVNETNPICRPKGTTKIKPIIMPANPDLLISDKPNLIPQSLNEHSPLDRSNTPTKDKKQEPKSQVTSGRKVLSKRKGDEELMMVNKKCKLSTELENLIRNRQEPSKHPLSVDSGGKSVNYCSQQKITSPCVSETNPIGQPKVMTEIKPNMPANPDLLISDKSNLIPQSLNQHSPLDRSNTPTKDKKQEPKSQDTSGGKVLSKRKGDEELMIVNKKCKLSTELENLIRNRQESSKHHLSVNNGGKSVNYCTRDEENYKKQCTDVDVVNKPIDNEFSLRKQNEGSQISSTQTEPVLESSQENSGHPGKESQGHIEYDDQATTWDSTHALETDDWAWKEGYTDWS
uniref:Uncharacterized protein n=1 Tax=Bombyx mori TaxID=7091 RepID=A0A8R2R8X9_BOMMO|nr:uncharacterized protein LOC101744973 isoform X4 [Bombyx mori]